jgi:hypothetical protein
VFILQQAFDYAAFSAAGGPERKKLTLATLHQGATRVARAQGWPEEPFREARACVVDKGYVNEWLWPKPKASPDRRLKAVLSCVHEPESFRAWLVVSDREGEELARRLVLEKAPSEFQFVPLLGKLAWESNDTVALFAKNGKEVGSLQVRREGRS